MAMSSSNLEKRNRMQNDIDNFKSTRNYKDYKDLSDNTANGMFRVSTPLIIEDYK